MKKNIKTIRDETLLEQLILVDGKPGCGKTLFTAIIAAMERVELLNFSAELENLCALNFLKKIDNDAVDSMIRIQTDLIIYETMMSRRTNFRPGDLSSVFRDVDIWSYFKRLFSKGEENVPELIKKERPILHFATHNLLAFSEPIFRSLGERVAIIEVIRHPLYMLIQQTLNQINHYNPSGTARQFHLYIRHGNQQVPFWNYGQEELYINSNPVERAIHEMNKLTELSENFKKQESGGGNVKILTIPFELFVIDPWPYLAQIEKLLGCKVTKKTKRMIKKQNVPRKKISDGIPLSIYKRCGWEPPVSDFTEKEELKKRREFAINQGASRQSLNLLDKMSSQYEDQFLKGII